MPRLDLSKLIAAGAEDPAKTKPGVRTEFRDAHKNALLFNQSYKADYTEIEERAQVDRLDRILEVAGTWMTSKPLKQETAGTSADKANRNKARWGALAEICQQCSLELISMGFRPLSGHWNPDPLSDPGDHPNYWLERLDPKHRGAGALKERYKKWAKSDKDVGFFEFLDADISAHSLPSVKYNKGIDKAQATQRRAERRKSQVQVVNGQLCGTNVNSGIADSANVFNTTTGDMKTEFAGPGFAIFVWDLKKRIFSGAHIANLLHHSTPRGGKPVRCAGEFRTNSNGKIVMITSKTGHYTTTPVEFKTFLQHLDALNAFAPSAFCVPDTSGQALKSWEIYRVDAWLRGGAPAPSPKNDLLTPIPTLATDLKSRNFWLRLSD